jgi:hypothetical protein
MNRTNESLPRTPTLAAGPGGVHVIPCLFFRQPPGGRRAMAGYV